VNTYSEHILLFIDILGFSNYVKASTKDRNLLDRLIEAIKKPKDIDPDKFVLIDIGDISNVKVEISAFSDTILVSCDPSYQGFLYLLLYTRILYYKLLRLNLYFRGAITLGPLIHSNDYIIGPSLVEAHDIEKKIAIYPRVIITENLLELLSKETKFRIDFVNRFITKGIEDELLFVNVLFPYSSMSMTDDAARKLFEPINVKIKEAINITETNDSMKIIKKYLWFNKYMERTLGRHNSDLFLILSNNRK